MVAFLALRTMSVVLFVVTMSAVVRVAVFATALSGVIGFVGGLGRAAASGKDEQAAREEDRASHRRYMSPHRRARQPTRPRCRWPQALGAIARSGR
jgi:hypothetical protein